MISSKELMDKAGLSRATLNNYISLGLLPRPELRSADPSGARVLGYFPAEALGRVEHIRELKSQGWAMTQIAAELGGQPIGTVSVAVSAKSTAAEGRQAPPAAAVDTGGRTSSGAASFAQASVGKHGSPRLQLSLDEVDHPAYMFSYNFELTWFNEAARNQILGGFERLPSDSDHRHILPMLVSEGTQRDSIARSALLRAHLQIIRSRLSKAMVLNTLRGASIAMQQDVAALYDDVEGDAPQKVAGLTAAVTVPLTTGALVTGGSSQLIATYFREGVLVVCVPDDSVHQTLAQFLSRRDLMIRHLLRNRLPVLTPLAVLVADLQGSTRICSELPPEEYFELINEIWSAMDPIFRSHGATHGKHVGDGMVYFFFPQPDTHYAFNALQCACEMGAEMRKISNRWALRKGWFNELHLNTGLHEGTEWLGTFQTATSIEFAVLGDTINQAARLSDFARHGAVWASKGLIGKLSSEERSRLHYGVTRKNQEGREVFVASTFAQIGSLMDAQTPNKVSDVAQMAVTEVRSVS